MLILNKMNKFFKNLKKHFKHEFNKKQILEYNKLKN